MHAYRGIPYAAPPTGPLRWQAPRPHVARQGIQDGTDFAPACPQDQANPDWYRDLAAGFGVDGRVVPELARISEDCLYLNVWAPAEPRETLRPVMVWIHGGGNVSGYAYEPNYRGGPLAASGIVAVSLNYRLGPLGFMAHPALAQEDRQQVSAYYGLADQLAALEWVKENIAAFGGDPENVTVFGESAGGGNIAALMRMLTWTDPVRRSGFVEDWTIFYWAWWIAFGPFVGLFVTRISRGRPLRELILSMAVFGSLGSWVFYIVAGNYALYLDLNGIVAVRDIVHAADPAQAIAGVIGALPFGALAQTVFAVIGIIFIATTYNSAAYALASAASQQLGIGDDPARWHRLFWAIVLGLLPVALMAVNGGVRVIMSAVLVASLPLLVIAVLMCVNLARSLQADHEELG